MKTIKNNSENLMAIGFIVYGLSIVAVAFNTMIQVVEVIK